MDDLAIALLLGLAIGTVCAASSRRLVLWLARRAGQRAGVNGLSRRSLRDFAELKAVAFDKHGTITTGSLKVVSVDPIRRDADRDMRWFAGALEHHADHPVGRAIARLATRGNVREVQHFPGCGITGSVDRHPVRVGRPSWLGVTASSEIGTVVAVEVDGRPVGTITVADEVLDGISSLMTHLATVSIIPVLITSDRAAAAEDLGTRAGVNLVIAEVGADDRPRVEALVRREYTHVAFIDDGGRSILLADSVCSVAGTHNPLRAVSAATGIARALPSRQRFSWAVSTLLGCSAAFLSWLLLLS